MISAHELGVSFEPTIASTPLSRAGIITNNLQHEQIAQLMDVPTTRILRQFDPNINVLIPLHDNSTRIDQAASVAFPSLSSQPNSDHFRVVIGDNGLSQDGIQRLQASATQLGLELSFTDATPAHAGQRNPAYPRNRVLQDISARARDDAQFRGPVFELDSDCAVLPDSMQHMMQTLYANPDAVAITADIVPIDHLTPQTYSEAAQDAISSEAPHALPALWTPNGKVDIGAIVAFSSTIAGKTTGLLLNPEVVSHVVTHAKDVYVQMPHQSAEDMIAATVLSNLGTIYRDPRARVLDEARPTHEEVIDQQIRWGRDHVLLTHHLAELDLLEPGIHILEPRGKTWAEWTIPGSEEFRGFVINPQELQTVYQALINSDIDANLAMNAQVIEHVLTLVHQERPHNSNMVLRRELPTPAETTQSSRFSLDSKIARLTGNILGINDIYGSAAFDNGNVLPQTFLFGLRQSASWNI